MANQTPLEAIRLSIKHHYDFPLNPEVEIDWDLIWTRGITATELYTRRDLREGLMDTVAVEHRDGDVLLRGIIRSENPGKFLITWYTPERLWTEEVSADYELTISSPIY